MVHDDIPTWISHLQGQATRGELAGLKPIDLGDGTGTLSGERTIKIMLSDLDDLNYPDGSGDGDIAWLQERRCYLFGDFWRLRRLLS
jgi:hypothetical protein